MNDTKEKMIYYYCERGRGKRGKWVGDAFASYNGSFLHLKYCDVDLRLKCFVQTIHFNYVV
jgi:hypothetical protein